MIITIATNKKEKEPFIATCDFNWAFAIEKNNFGILTIKTEPNIRVEIDNAYEIVGYNSKIFQFRKTFFRLSNKMTPVYKLRSRDVEYGLFKLPIKKIIENKKSYVLKENKNHFLEVKVLVNHNFIRLPTIEVSFINENLKLLCLVIGLCLLKHTIAEQGGTW